jgi:hypothetical protein
MLSGRKSLIMNSVTRKKDMPDNSLDRAIELSRNGKKADAREILKTILRSDPLNETAWLWFADTFPDNLNRVAVLEECLKNNPDSQTAKNYLTTFKSEEAKTATTIQPQKPGTRINQTARPQVPIRKPLPAQNPSQKPNIKQSGKSNRPFIILAGTFGIIILLSMCIFGLWILQRQGMFTNIPTSTSTPEPTNTPEPVKRYSQEVNPYINGLIQYQTDFNQYVGLFFAYSDAHYIEVYNAHQQAYVAWQKDDPSTFWAESKSDLFGVSLESLIDPMNQLTRKGGDILNGIGLINPPDEIRVAHEQLIACLNVRVALTDFISWTFSNILPMDFTLFNNSYPADRCNTFDAAVTKIVTYVDDNK